MHEFVDDSSLDVSSISENNSEELLDSSSSPDVHPPSIKQFKFKMVDIISEKSNEDDKYDEDFVDKMLWLWDWEDSNLVSKTS